MVYLEDGPFFYCNENFWKKKYKPCKMFLHKVDEIGIKTLQQQISFIDWD